MAGDTAPLEDRGNIAAEAHRSHRLDRGRRFDGHPVGMGFAAGVVGILDHEKDRASPRHGDVELRITRTFAIVSRDDRGAVRIVEREERIEE
jgi:hypothetical protein